MGTRGTPAWPCPGAGGKGAPAAGGVTAPPTLGSGPTATAPLRAPVPRGVQPQAAGPRPSPAGCAARSCWFPREPACDAARLVAGAWRRHGVAAVPAAACGQQGQGLCGCPRVPITPPSPHLALSPTASGSPWRVSPCATSLALFITLLPSTLMLALRGTMEPGTARASHWAWLAWPGHAVGHRAWLSQPQCPHGTQGTAGTFTMSPQGTGHDPLPPPGRGPQALLPCPSRQTGALRHWQVPLDGAPQTMQVPKP